MRRAGAAPRLLTRGWAPASRRPLAWRRPRRAVRPIGGWWPISGRASAASRSLAVRRPGVPTRPVSRRRWPMATRPEAWRRRTARPVSWRPIFRRPVGRRATRPVAGRWSIGRRWPMHPDLSLPIPGAAHIMGIPVAGHAEGDDPEADHRAVGEHRHACSLIGIDEVPGVDPTAVGSRDDIAPTEIAQTTGHRDREAPWQSGDQRKVPRRSGAQVDVLGGVGPLRVRAGRQARQDQQQHRPGLPVLHFLPHFLVALPWPGWARDLPPAPCGQSVAAQPAARGEAPLRGRWPPGRGDPDAGQGRKARRYDHCASGRRPDVSATPARAGVAGRCRRDCRRIAPA